MGARDSGHLPSSSTRQDVLVLAGFFLFLLIFFSGILVMPGERWLGRADSDIRHMYYGWRVYGFGEIRAGRFPLWNPYEFLGMPFIAGLQPGMFYPTNWLCVVLPLGRAVNLGIILNLFLAGLFTYLWARQFGLRWTGAIIAAATYVLCGPLFLRILQAGDLSLQALMPWIPCILLSVEMLVCSGRRAPAIVLGSVAVAMEWFAGQPQYAFYGGAAAFLYLAGRLWQRRGEIGGRGVARTAGGFVLIYLIGSMLAGVQLVPALELLAGSVRQGKVTYDWVSQFAFVPEGLLSFLVPDVFGTGVGVQYWGRWNLWEMSAYVGIVALGLAFLAVLHGVRGKTLLLVCIALICLVLALAGAALCFGLVPGFGLFRAQARWLCPMCPFVGLLAGTGADSIMASAADAQQKAPKSSYGRGIWILTCLAALLVLAGGALSLDTGLGRAAWARFMDAMLSLGRPGVERTFNIAQFTTAPFSLAAMSAAGASMVRSGIFLGALAGLTWLTLRARLKPAWAAIILLLLVALDAWTFGRRYLETFDPRQDSLSPGAVKFLAQKTEPFRFERGRSFRLPECDGMAHHFGCIEGTDPNVPARFFDVFWALQSESIYRQARDKMFPSYFIYNTRPALRMLNLRYVVAYSSCPKLQIEGLRTVYEDPQIRIDELPDPWPRAWLVHRYVVRRDAAEVLALLPKFNYAKTALFEEDPHCAVEEPSAAEAVPEFERYEPGRIDIKLQAAAPALLVLSDLFYPGWEATMDGRPAEILRANYLMRALAIPAGAHQVRFLYRPASFRTGVAVSAAGCLALAWLISWRLWTRRRHENH